MEFSRIATLFSALCRLIAPHRISRFGLLLPLLSFFYWRMWSRRIEALPLADGAGTITARAKPQSGIEPRRSAAGEGGRGGPARPGGAPGARKVPLGFSPRSFEIEDGWEQRYLKLPNSRQCERFLRRLTSEPHVAGTPGDRRVTDFIAEEFRRDGLETEVMEYQVLLSYPKRVSLEMTQPDRIALAHPEPAVRGDKSTETTAFMATMPWNAYSPSADITAPVIYANYGDTEDYDQLAKLGVDVRGRIVLVRYFHGYRGGKSLEAEKRGAAGVLVYSDPAEDGAPMGAVYPNGPWGPLGHFQRGAVVYDFIVPGDPLTPGWASTPGAPRIAPAESRVLPKIPMIPLSAADASQILRRLGGPVAPRDWRGALPFGYHIGDGSTKVHLALEMEDRVVPIWDVIGKIRGSDEPDKLVILGNHHDAWVYGAVDPASGTATMLETARALGLLLRQGFRPRRTLVLGSWDAEEYTLTGSTEWGEQFEENLKQNAVVCLNVDFATSGSRLSVSLVPALLPAATEAAQAVRDPLSRQTLYDRWAKEKSALNVRSYAVAGSSAASVPFGILGGGSDFMVFLQHDGIPSADLAFDGPYGVYHSLYDDFDWMRRFGDPGFRYHAAMSRLWGIFALRFADADIEPLDYSGYATEIAAYLESLKSMAAPAFMQKEIAPLLEKCRRWHDAAGLITSRIEALRGSTASVDLEGRGAAAINSCLSAQERALLDPEGIPGRPWFRHLIYAPLPSYEAETLPGLREALTGHDTARAHDQAVKLGQAIDRAIEACRLP
ncbi:MAG TPA: M28 family metallopeptidase [Terriglobia bacterium]|nr:M28 family metallopeptidase [Terriglobia bacterium]